MTLGDLAAWIDPLGYAAACLTTASFVPQALLTLRTRNVTGISLGMYASFTAGIALWLIYGVMLGSWPIIVANTLTLGLAATILAVKVWEERGNRGAGSSRPTPPSGLGRGL